MPRKIQLPIRPPVMRRKCAYGIYAYDSKGKKIILFYPFIPRRNSRLPAVMSFKRHGASLDTQRHFQFHHSEDATTFAYWEIKKKKL